MRVLTGQYQLNLHLLDQHTKWKNWNWASNILKGLSWCICKANTAHSLRVSVETIQGLYHFLSHYQWAKAYWNHWQNQHLDSRLWKTSPFHKLWNVLDCKNAFSHIYLKLINIRILFYFDFIAVFLFFTTKSKWNRWSVFSVFIWLFYIYYSFFIYLQLFQIIKRKSKVLTKSYFCDNGRFF